MRPPASPSYQLRCADKSQAEVFDTLEYGKSSIKMCIYIVIVVYLLQRSTRAQKWHFELGEGFLPVDESVEK